MMCFSPLEVENIVMKKKQKTSTNSRCCQWSDLPTDVSDQINGRLNLYDQVRFHAVCKNWQAAQYKRNPSDSLPWHLSIPKPSNNIFEIQLYEPSQSHLHPASVDKICLHQYLGPHPYLNITYKYGWLLFSVSTYDVTCTNFLLYSVFTKKFKTLPPLLLQKGHNVDFDLSFSAEPNSHDCVFIVLGAIGNNRCTVSTLNCREKQWITKEFDNKNFVCDHSMVVFIGGVFYFVNINGQTSSYDITSQVWTSQVWTNELEDKYFPATRMYNKHGDFQLDGQVTSLSDKTFYPLRRFDSSRKDWINVKSLGDRALFVSDDNSFPISTIGEEARSNGILANKLYWLPPSGVHVYSLKDGRHVRLVKCKNGSGIKNWFMNIEKYMVGLCSGSELCCWIEPPDQWVKRKQTRDETLHRNSLLAGVDKL